MRNASIAAVFAVLVLGAATQSAEADVSSASFDGTTATLNLDGANDNLTVSVSDGLLAHTGVPGGLAGSLDWDSEKPDVQTVPADGTVDLVINAGAGNDTINVLAGSSALARATVNGEAGDDFLAGAETDDRLSGGDGNDTLFGRQGTDVMSGGAGDDTFIWENGDGSDRQNGDTGDDTAEVDGAPTLGDTFTIEPVPGGVTLRRTNLGPFKLDTATEHLQVNGLGGDDSITAAGGTGAATQLAVDAGDGNDQVNIRDNALDTAIGGDGTDSVVADTEDIVDGFESVDGPPVATQPPPAVTPPPAAAPPPSETAPPALFLAPPNFPLPPLVTISSRTAKFSNGRAAIKVKCPATPAGDCRGSLTLLTTKRIEIARTRYAVRRGATATLTLKVRRASRQLIEHGRLIVLARVRRTVSGAAAQSSRRLTLLRPTHQERHRP
jgi:hypothetical protein